MFGESDERERKVPSKAPVINAKPVITADAAGVLLRSLMMFSRSTTTLVSWLSSLCTTAAWEKLEGTVRLQKQGQFVRAQLSRLQLKIKMQVSGVDRCGVPNRASQGHVRPSPEDTQELLRGLRKHDLELPEGVAADSLCFLSRITVEGLFKVTEQLLCPVPFGAEVAARVFLTWHIAGSAANPGAGAVETEYQSTWKKLEDLTPLSWEAIPKRIKEHPWIREVRLFLCLLSSIDPDQQ